MTKANFWILIYLVFYTFSPLVCIALGFYLGKYRHELLSLFEFMFYASSAYLFIVLFSRFLLSKLKDSLKNDNNEN